MGLGVALKAFSAALFNRSRSDAIAAILSRPASELVGLPAPDAAAAADSALATTAETMVRAAGRDSAVTLLATLQRESRLIDLIQEDLANFSDAQVGAAARPCLSQCRQTLARHFALGPVMDAAEGGRVEVSADASAARVVWTGESASASAGKLIHPGWLATKVELAEWTGDREDALVIAPAQVQAGT